MLATWIETAAKGRLGGPVRAGMWSTAVIGTHPIQDNQRVWVELSADELVSGLAAGLLDREQGRQQPLDCADSAAGRGGSAALSLDRRTPPSGETAESTYQDTIVRPEPS